MSDLLPCPFCGSAVKVGEPTDIDYIIYCDSCGVSGPVCEGKESAIEAWNRRAPDPHAQVAALREALGDYMSAFGQGLEAYGIPYGPQQVGADEKARAALRGTGDGWVPVTERLPEGDADVLVYWPAVGIIIACADELDADITHWRPLPPPPAGKEGQA